MACVIILQTGFYFWFDVFCLVLIMILAVNFALNITSQPTCWWRYNLAGRSSSFPTACISSAINQSGSFTSLCASAMIHFADQNPYHRGRQVLGNQCLSPDFSPSLIYGQTLTQELVFRFPPKPRLKTVTLSSLSWKFIAEHFRSQTCFHHRIRSSDFLRQTISFGSRV